jgi:glycosyltransferase involved in cell wall biosynthesis
VRLGVSGLFVRSARVGGAEFMLLNLMMGLGQIRAPDDHIQLYVDDHWRHPQIPGIEYVGVPRTRVKNRFLRETIVLPRFVQQLDIVLFPNYFTPPRAMPAKTVTVIHDLQYRYFPENFTPQKRAWLRLSHALTLRRADAVVAISEYTRQDLLRFHGRRWSHKVHVIHNPVSWERFGELPVTDSGADPEHAAVVLAVAAHYPHKNLDTLIRSFVHVRRERPDARLTIAGQLPEQLVGVRGFPDLRQLIVDLGLREAVTVTGHVTDAVMGQLYRSAALFAFPSLFEGFGMPPVEALGMGLPVLTTRCGAIPEVTGGLCELLDNPRDERELAWRIIQMIADPAKYRPAPSAVEAIRRHYAPAAVAREYYALFQ